MKHFDNFIKNCDIPQLKPEAYNTLMEMLVDLSETNYKTLQFNFPIGKVVFIPQSSTRVGVDLASGDIDLNDGDL